MKLKLEWGLLLINNSFQLKAKFTHLSCLSTQTGSWSDLQSNCTTYPTIISIRVVVEPAGLLGIRKTPSQPMTAAHFLIQWQGAYLLQTPTGSTIATLQHYFMTSTLRTRCLSLGRVLSWMVISPSPLLSIPTQGKGRVRINKILLYISITLFNIKDAVCSLLQSAELYF